MLGLNLLMSVVIQFLVPISLNKFPLQFKYNDNIALLSAKFQLNDHCKIFTWHDGLCKSLLYYNMMARNGMIVKQNFHQTWIVTKISLVNQEPDLCEQPNIAFVEHL